MYELQPHEGSSETTPRTREAIHELRFNPTRVRLKRERSLADQPSTRLQPHEGSSETICRREHHPTYSSLQPHEGSSETIYIYGEPGSGKTLQPHEGSSETIEQVHGRPYHDASTPRGFV